jgi:PAS domain S-box-containing protein
MSSDQFVQLAELFPVAGLAETDLTGRFLHASPRYCEIVGRTAEELSQLRMQDITHPDDLPGNLSLFETLGRDGPPYVIEKRYLRPDGSAVWVQINVTAPKHAASQPRTALAVVIDITERKRAEAALRESEARLETELADTQLLQAISTQLIHEQNADALYERLLKAAAGILRADFASVQILDPERGELRLLAHQGFTPEGAKAWEWVCADSETSCAAAMRTGRRVVVTDVANCDLLAGTAGLAKYLQAGIRAMQSTPLVARDGRLVGMISTHWRRPHQPSERDLRLLDILARQAADLIERKRSEEALRASEEQQAFLLKLSDALRPLADPAAIQREACRLLGEHLEADRAYYAEIDEAQGCARVQQDYLRGDSPSLAGVHATSDYGWVLPPMRRGEIIRIEDVDRSDLVPEADRSVMAAIQVAAHVNVPLVKGGALVGALCVTEPRPRTWSEFEVELVRETAERIWAAVERAKAEEAARQRAAQFETLFNQSPQGVYLVDADFRIRELNPLARAGFGDIPGGVIGRDFDEVIHILWRKEYADELVRRFRHTLETGESYFAAECAEYRIDRGETECYERRLARIPLPDGRHGVVCYFRDISDRVKARDALARLADESERQRRLYDAILSGTPDLVYVFDLNHRFTYANQALLAMWGRTWDESIGKNCLELGYPDWHAALHGREIEQVKATKQPIRGEVPFTGANGTRTYDYIFVPVIGANGEVEAVAGTTRDVTDRKRAEAELRESEQRFRQFAEHSRKLFWMTDPVAGRVLYVNHGYRDIWGRTDESLYADPQSFLEGVHPDDRPRMTEAIQRQAAGEMTTQEYRVIRPDGSMRWVVDRAFPIRDEMGQVYRVAGIAEDTTARKRTEEDMRFLAGASSALASLMDDASTLQKVARLAVPFFADWCAVDMLDADGALRRVAVAHVDPTKVELAHELHRRYPPDPAAPQGVWNILRTGQSEMISEISEELITASVPDAEQLRTIRELGLRSYIGVPLVAHGRVLGAITFITAESGRLYDANDLTVAEDLAYRAAVAVENAKLYDSLKESDRRKDEFLAVLAHELRNPLAPIRNALHIMKLPTATPQAISRIRDVAERQVTHLTRLVDDLLDVSRIVRGKIELRKERVELSTIVNRAIETARPVIDAEKHEFSAVIDAAPIWVNVDPVRLAQVVANLLNNAAKYTEKGGRIRLTVGQEGDAAVIRVGDTGIGLDRDMLSRIFEMFIQAAPAHARSQGGLGIGLTLVKNLVEMHGGTVTAHSDGPGRGSEFVVRLPLDVRAERARGEAVMNHDGTTSAPNARRVLVVDDNTDAAESLAVLLRLSGHEAQVANDGFAALKVAHAMRPDLILLDIGMPGMDGYEVARRLRQDAAFHNVKLVALTGWGQEEDRRRSKSAGFDAHYVKPIDPDVLEQLLD